ncbi:hypothetical protein [Jiangella asiatica]|uniref:Uncharacterized protein n=1 Tax=Jiangella asiatica TaxID=2530372 RepID=A0A4R5CN83_9ACTN|nr:hypothetical protein [Jiangella asiatica]TDE01486.1 hypothetical protein E1269_23185 [Jiangella asiatica]
MLPLHVLDDATIEALIAGRAVAPELEPLAGLVRGIRAASSRPVQPSRALAVRIASGDFDGVEPAPAPQRPARRLRTWLAASSPRARAVAGAAVLFTGLTAATAAGAMPEGAQARMQTLIESVTPISFERDAEPDLVDVVDESPTRGDDTGRETSSGTSNDRPDQTGKPETPPGKPEDPGIPEEPEPPGKPATPPGKPESPPGKPEGPPGKPDDPGKPDKPEEPPGKPDEPGNPDDSGSSDHAEGQQGSGQENRPTGPKR